LDKAILLQYCSLQAEIKNLKRKMKELEEQIDHIGEVSDTVKGTRQDGTIGNIRVSGYPEPEYYSKKLLLTKRKFKMELLEAELLEMVNQVEEYIQSIPNSELRMIFQLYYMDDLTWPRVALCMNDRFPKKRISYTEDGCRMRHNRYLKKN